MNPDKVIPPAVVILKALIRGHDVTLGGNTYRIVDGVLLMGGEECDWDTCMTVTQFLELCSAVPADDVFLIGANMALKQTRSYRG